MASQSSRPKIAFYWAASCGGCEITITELGMQLAVIGDLVDIVFWPCIMDYKYSNVEAMANGEIDVCFFNGGIRTDETRYCMGANLLAEGLAIRATSRIVEANKDTMCAWLPRLGRHCGRCFIIAPQGNWSPMRSCCLCFPMSRTLGMLCGWRFRDMTGSLKEPNSPWSKG